MGLVEFLADWVNVSPSLIVAPMCTPLFIMLVLPRITSALLFGRIVPYMGADEKLV